VAAAKTVINTAPDILVFTDIGGTAQTKIKNKRINRRATISPAPAAFKAEKGSQNRKKASDTRQMPETKRTQDKCFFKPVTPIIIN